MPRWEYRTVVVADVRQMRGWQREVVEINGETVGSCDAAAVMGP
jgi:hypothetical protein